MELNCILTPFLIFGPPAEERNLLNFGDFDPLLRRAKYEMRYYLYIWIESAFFLLSNDTKSNCIPRFLAML